MGERNICHELRCPAACCRNVSGEVAVRKEFFLKAFPTANEVGSKKELELKIENQELGVYYYSDSWWTYFAISGSCPNLLPDMSCGIHDKPYYPPFCRNMIVASEGCELSKEIYEINLKVIAGLSSLAETS